jgi:hypothetical protein
MPSCPSCGRDIGKGATYCGYCGASADGPGPGASPDVGTAPPASDYWVCRSCSVENLADDAFCSVCGSARPESPSLAAAAVASPAAARFAPGTPSAAAWACSACGATNDRGSSFCWSCGTRAGAVGAGPAVGVSAVGFAAPPAPAKAGHAGRWVAIIVAVVLIAAAIAAGVVVLRGGDSGSTGGSTGDSGATLTVDQSAAASTAVADGASTSSPVARDVTGNCISARSARCLRSDNGNTYSAGNLIDGSMTTCWAEGAPGFGLGETLRFKFSPKMTLTRMEVMPGYKKYQNGWDRWDSNGRLREITVTFADGSEQSFQLEDSERWQSCDFGEQTGSSIQMTIADVYYPDAGNSHYAEDTSFSEVRFFGWPASEASL